MTDYYKEFDFDDYITEKYTDLSGQFCLVDINLGSPLQKGENLGLNLVGNKDLNKMSVFVCDIKSGSCSEIEGTMQVGDELLEINGEPLYGRSHLNASPIITSVSQKSSKIQLIVHRDKKNFESMAATKLRNFNSEKTCEIQAYSPTSVHDESYLTPLLRSAQTAQCSEVIKILVNKDIIRGYGLTVNHEEAVDDIPSRVVINHLDIDGAAEKAGILQGDRLLQIDGSTIAGLTSEEIQRQIDMTKDHLLLTISRHITMDKNLHHDEFCDYQNNLIPNRLIKSRSLHQNRESAMTPKKDLPKRSESTISQCSGRMWHPPAPNTLLNHSSEQNNCTTSQSSQIQPGVETDIEISRVNKGLGLSILGGKDTCLNCILIHEIYVGGAAEKDGRLWAGDQILQINRRDVRHYTHQEANAALLNCSHDTLHLKIYRDHSPLLEEDIYDILEVELERKPNKGFGFSIASRSAASSAQCGVFILDIIKNGIAEADGRLKPGDQILEIDSIDVRTSVHHKVATLLKSSMGKIKLKVGRLLPNSESNSVKSSSPLFSSISSHKKKTSHGFSSVMSSNS